MLPFPLTRSLFRTLHAHVVSAAIVLRILFWHVLACSSFLGEVRGRERTGDVGRVVVSPLRRISAPDIAISG